MQGLMDYPNEIGEYFNSKGVSLIFIFRKNLLRRMVSLLANIYDTNAKLLNGTHKAHVQSHQEVTLFLFLHSFIYYFTRPSRTRTRHTHSVL